MRDVRIVKSQVARARPSIGAVIASLAGRRQPAILDSAATGPRRGRFSIAACDPVCTLVGSPDGGDPFEALRGHLRQATGLVRSPDGTEPATRVFPGGWIGYFAYEAGRFIERLPATVRPDVSLPIARWSLYDTAAIHDARTGLWTIVAADLSGLGFGPDANRPIADRLADWQNLLQHSQYQDVTRPASSPAAEPDHNMSRLEYEQKVRQALDYIAAGDIYQVNLARRETYAAREPAVATYLRLRRANPAAYAAFLQWQQSAEQGAAREAAILSSSPELFLQLRGRRVLTRPIKGTRPRGLDPGADRSYRQALSGSPKDRAELAMIVDLERNDLGRVCEYGSIRVVCPGTSPACPYRIETHPTVHHLVADVTGTLAKGRDAVDLVRACFPGGSITGAPKIRAMEIIDELEPTERSVYTGSIGWFSLTGDMMLNIAIRTLIIAGGRLHLYTGGGIVADSGPADEYRETQAKALGMRRALGLADPDGKPLDPEEPLCPASCI